MILEKDKVKREEDIDFDFDMSIYEREEEKQEEIKSIDNMHKNKPAVTGFRSKYSMSINELENLGMLKTNISQYAISVARNSQDIQDLWKLYGCLNEYWARIKDIFGYITINDMEKRFRIIKNTLLNHKTGRSLPYKYHEALLRLRDNIYMIAQRSNLGLEIEGKYNATLKKSENAIVQ